MNAKSLEQALQEAFRTADTLQAPLDAGLKFYLGESRKLLPELEATYDQLVERISANAAEAPVPAIGENLPDFVMPDSEGHLVALTSLLEAGPLVISLLPQCVCWARGRSGRGAAARLGEHLHGRGDLSGRKSAKIELCAGTE